MFIGEAPGKTENEQGYPFMGRSGQLLNLWMKEFGLTFLSGITNTVPLIPLNPAGAIRRPTLLEIEYFRPFVAYMLDKYKPILLILLGDTACQSLLKQYIGNIRNTLIEKGKYFVTAHYHPSYYLRGRGDGLEDFGKLYETVIRQIFPDLKTTIQQAEKTEEQDIKELLKTNVDAKS
jgi:DNA polymerase